MPHLNSFICSKCFGEAELAPVCCNDFMKSSANDFFDKSFLLFQYHKIEPKNSDLGTVF